MDWDRLAPLRPYLIPVLGFAAVAGGIRDVGGGIRALLTYSHASDPFPLTPLFVFGLGIIIVGLGSVAIGYRAIRSPGIVPLTMLSIMVTFLALQVVVYVLLVVLQPSLSYETGVTNATRAFAVSGLLSIAGADFLFRVIRRGLEAHRRRHA